MHTQKPALSRHKASITGWRIFVAFIGVLLVVVLMPVAHAQTRRAKTSANGVFWQFQPRILNAMPNPQLPPAQPTDVLPVADQPMLTTAQQLTPIEQHLYGKTYEAETLTPRLIRVERSLQLPTPPANVPPHLRLTAIQAHVAAQPPLRSGKGYADIGTLEQRLLRTQHPHWPMPQRLAQLEDLTFGQVFEADPVPQRLQRLYEQIPLHNRAVQLVVPAVNTTSTTADP
jgi:hypothetical protein